MDFRKQAGINSIGSVVLMFGQWLISVLLVRLGGYEDAGVFSLAMTISNVFSFFANYGIRNYQVADVEHRYSPGQYLLARLTTSGISVAACVVYLLVSGGYTGEERIAILLYLLYSDLNVIGDCMMGALQLAGRLEINGYSNMIRGVGCFVVYMILYLLTHSLIVSLAGMVVMAAAVLLLYDLRLYNRFRGSAGTGQTGQSFPQILRGSFALMLSQLLPIVTTALPRRVIQLHLGTEQLGYFSSVFTPTVLLTTMIPAVVISFVPRMADFWQKREDGALLRMNAICYGGVVLVVLAAEIAALLCGRPVMKLVFGDEILQYMPLLYWAILATGLNVFTLCGNAVLTAIHNNIAVAVSAAAAMVIVYLVSEPLCLRHGIYGAAFALAIGYGIQMLIQCAVFFWTLGRHRTAG